MSRTTDIIVVGSGLAGLMAAWAATKAGKSVKVISEGMGCLAISPGCVDVLGYDSAGQRLENPFDGFAGLGADHPYSILGKDLVVAALEEYKSVLASKGLVMRNGQADGKDVNTLMPTIMGTLKPTWLVPENVDASALFTANKILVVGVHGFRDCRPALIVSQLLRYPELAAKEFGSCVLPEPFKEHGRSLNALDLAHAVDRDKGREWLLEQLRGRGRGYDLALLPPMLGSRPTSPVRRQIADVLGCPFIEMLSVPPGVTGMRVREALAGTLVECGVEFYENAQVTRAEVLDGRCVRLALASSGREIFQEAGAFVIATGGILSGGVIMEQGKAHEAIFGLDIPVPQNVDDWSEPNVFGRHLFSRLGVSVNEKLNASAGLAENVFFAGRTLGGYDHTTEKSGHGVACATGYVAGRNASEYVAAQAGGK